MVDLYIPDLLLEKICCKSLYLQVSQTPNPYFLIQPIDIPILIEHLVDPNISRSSIPWIWMGFNVGWTIVKRAQ